MKEVLTRGESHQFCRMAMNTVAETRYMVDLQLQVHMMLRTGLVGLYSAPTVCKARKYSRGPTDLE